ncbi:polycomb protein eed-A isoform X3 [Hydra vulgaris]|uniref:Polycomb protein eed-A isoform X3 n=1 Tax=Hydra vulgaris TaxID=6087 RepID=A0ABM4BLL0_HYDVU
MDTVNDFIDDSYRDNDDDTDSSQTYSTSSKTKGKKVCKKKWKKQNKHDENSTGKSKLNFKCTNFIKEDHKQPIFGVQFYQQCLIGEDDPLIFGTVGSNRVSVYKCAEDSGQILLLQSYADSDPEESFYACSWTYDPDNRNPLFCFAGAKGIIHILNPCIRQVATYLQGHGSAINELKTHPIEPLIILSASKDHTIRMWNIKTEVCVAIFGGVDGHRDEVLGIDFDVLGTKIVSCGMDHSLKFWSLETEKCKKKLFSPHHASGSTTLVSPRSTLFVKVINDSHAHSSTERIFHTLNVHYPEYTTREVHRNYVDCCVWLGDLVISKSCDNQVVCWKTKQPIETVMKRKNNSDVGVFVLHKFDIDLCDIWFIRFAVDLNQTILALGNQIGKVYLYDLEGEHPAHAKYTLLFIIFNKLFGTNDTFSFQVYNGCSPNFVQ